MVKSFKDLYLIIDYYENMEENWDGYGAKAPSKEICNFARELISLMEHYQIIIPKSQVTSHEIGFYYNNTKDDYFEISCDEDGLNNKTVYYIVCVNGEKPYGGEFSLDSFHIFLEEYNKLKNKIII